MKIISKNKIPIKMWLDNCESGAIDQASNLANLPFAFKHIAIMPDCHQGFGMPIGGVLATKNVVIPNAVGVDIGCFSGDTKVPLLSGIEKTLKDLTKEKIPFYIYSINDKKEITGGLAISKKTRKNAEIIKVILDNGKEIKCTPDHRFMLRNGNYCDAKDLKNGDSLMPLYKKYNKDNYESIYNPKTKTYQRTHWLLARMGVLGEIPSFENQTTIIHHSDFNKNNNCPENLKFMGNKDHSKYHRSIVERNTYFNSDDFKKKRLKKLKEKGFYDSKFKDKKKVVAIENITKYNKSKKKKEQDKLAGQRGKKYLIKYNKSKKGRLKSSEMGKKYGFGKKVDNHKIIKIIKLKKREDVYCLTVNKYHNFALSAGVFVHNCGMCAVKTSLTEIDTETLKKIMGEIRKAIPVGFNHHKEMQDYELMPEKDWGLTKFNIIDEEYSSAKKQIGTLGGGNHFIEIQKGSDGHIWIMIHSGSRNLGFKVAEHYNKLAKELNAKWKSEVPLSWDLAFLPLDSKEGQDYLREMNYCVDFALANRKLIMDRIKNIFKDLEKISPQIKITFDKMINIAHNYASIENHFKQNVMVHRKGATLAREDTIGIIPGSQGTSSYIIKGKGNPESFMSCSHGAGRLMSRKKAKEELDLETEQKMLDDQGIIHSIRNVSDLDEAPSAYKPIEEVMTNQSDLVEILVKLTPLAVIKG